MSEVFYSVSILFKDEAIANKLSGRLISSQSKCDFELIKLINFTLKCDVDSLGYEYSIDSLKVFKNEIQIICYSGRSEPPLGIAEVINDHGASILRISESYDEAPKSLSKYFIDGKKSNKKEYGKNFKKYKIEDDTDKLQRFLSNENLSAAEEIVDKCDLKRIEPEHRFLCELIHANYYVSLTKKLLRAGLYEKGSGEDALPWLEVVVQYGTTELLNSFIEHGFDPYYVGSRGETALHSCLYLAEKNSLSNIKCLIAHCTGDLNFTTQKGSPLWFGYKQGGNIPGCLLFQAAGAKIIPPAGFYDDKGKVEIIVEAIKHRDEDTFKENYADEYYNLALFGALRCQSFSIINWLNSRRKIDWQSFITDEIEFDKVFDEYFLELPLHEIPLALSDGGECDYQLLNFIIDNLEPCNETYNKFAVYISGFNFLPGSVALLKKLKRLGAQFNVIVPINKGDDESSLNNALRHECVENLDYLFEVGATIPNATDLGIESIEACIENYFEEDSKCVALELLEKHGLVF